MRFLRLVLKNLRRRPARTGLTVLGVASALLLFVLVESLSAGLERSLSGTEAARTLVVYRKNRYCPQTSFLPEWYATRIAELDGVETVLPVKVFLNNCRASLDQITFQGAPVETLLEARSIEVADGDLGAFQREHDAALVGRDFAARKGLAPGDRFRFGDVDVKVRGVFESEERTEESVILTHLEFLQRAGPVNRLGTVTQFEVRIASGADGEAIARTIDEEFRTAEEPTDTRPRVAFLDSATRDLREILRFGRWLGMACVLVVLILVGNTILMSVQERVRELGVLRALGFPEGTVAGLVVAESLALALAGGLLGVGGVFAVLNLTHLALGSEGVTIVFAASPGLLAEGLLVAAAAGVLAGLAPAWRSARAEIVESLRSAG